MRALLDALRERRESDEGFTLIELMVVVLIIAILIAIAIPTFLGAQDRARDRGAQADLRNALTAAKTVATDNEGLFFEDDGEQADVMNSAEPSLHFSDTTDSAAEKTIEVHTFVASDDSGAVGPSFETGINMNRLSASGTMFCIQATREGAVTYGRNEDGDVIDDADCDQGKF
jgi:type IV pilus assembly protein PilA